MAIRPQIHKAAHPYDQRTIFKLEEDWIGSLVVLCALLVPFETNAFGGTFGKEGVTDHICILNVGIHIALPATGRERQLAAQKNVENKPIIEARAQIVIT
jgi:hypothetical protein